MANTPAIKIKAIKELTAGRSLRRVAKKFHVHTMTLERWLRRFRQAGSDYHVFEKTHFRPHNRLDRDQEEVVCLLKEHEPGLTLIQAQKRLRRLGITACPATVQRIWREAGYADLPSGHFPPVSSETQRALSEAKRILDEQGSIRKAAGIVNRLPACPDLKLLAVIPDRHLSLHRRLEKLDAMRTIEPMPVFYRRSRLIRQLLERKKYFHSALQAGFVEASALAWLNHPMEGLTLIEHLRRFVPGRLSRFIRFKLLFYQCRFLADMLRTRQAVESARQCGLLLKSLNRYDLEVRLSQLYSSLGEYGKARQVLERAMARPDAVITKDERLSRAAYCAIAGDYDTARSIIHKLPEPDDNYKSFYFITLALCELGAGDPRRVLELSQKALSFSRREGFINIVQASVMMQASAHAALGFNRQAMSSIKKVMPLLAKHKDKRDLCIHELLTRTKCGSVRSLSFPPVNLLFRLKKAGHTGRPGDYRAAYALAKSKGLLGIFHRYCLLAPEAVNKNLSRAKPVHLPRPILRQPVFNRDLPSLHVDFLGPLQIFRNEQPVKTRLRPKDAAFFIHILAARDYRLSLEECLKNFWPEARDPKNNLYHLLRRLRQQLMIPAQYLYVKNRSVCYAGSGITDFKLLQESLALARASSAAQETAFACQEYRRAFQLVRGEPFHMIYDQWSEDLRSRILGQVESATADYALSCHSTQDAVEAGRLLSCISKIIPNSNICTKSLHQVQALDSESAGTAHRPARRDRDASV